MGGRDEQEAAGTSRDNGHPSGKAGLDRGVGGRAPGRVTAGPGGSQPGGSPPPEVPDPKVPGPPRISELLGRPTNRQGVAISRHLMTAAGPAVRPNTGTATTQRRPNATPLQGSSAEPRAPPRTGTHRHAPTLEHVEHGRSATTWSSVARRRRALLSVRAPSRACNPARSCLRSSSGSCTYPARIARPFHRGAGAARSRRNPPSRMPAGTRGRSSPRAGPAPRAPDPHPAPGTRHPAPGQSPEELSCPAR